MAPRKKTAERPRRRKPGTGAIRWKAARAQWEAAFPIGHRQYRYDYFQARSEAEAHLDRLVAERSSVEAPRDVAGGSQRVSAFLIIWLNIKAPHIKPKTLCGYKYLCELASAEIGGYRVDEVTREMADRLLAYFHKRTFKNVSQMRAVLRQAFAYALEEEYIKRNPFDRAKAPHVERRQAETLTIEQRRQLLNAARGDRLEVLWHLYSRLGLRKGEGLGLRWCDIDWEKGTLTIRQQYTAIGSQVILSTPKTKRSLRTIPIPADILALLIALPRDGDLIFCLRDGSPQPPYTILPRLRRLLVRAKLPPTMTVHDLRHTALYLMEHAGAAPSAVQAIAGHSSQSMTRHYVDHADLAAMRQAIEITISA